MIGTGFVFLMLTVAVNPAQSEGRGVALGGNEATLTCSGGTDGSITWRKGSEEQTEKNKTLTVEAKHGVVSGEFRCEYINDNNRQVTEMFYINAKVCENCYELNSLRVAAVIFGDLLITGAVILGVYVCVLKNTGSTQQKASKPRTQSAPPVPNPDYQVLNQRTRTTDVYSALK